MLVTLQLLLLARASLGTRRPILGVGRFLGDPRLTGTRPDPEGVGPSISSLTWQVLGESQGKGLLLENVEELQAKGPQHLRLWSQLYTYYSSPR
jgi:hypothetical protein